MTSPIDVDGVRFEFPSGWRVSKFDRWSFYLNQFQSVCGGAKAVDLLAIDTAKRLWLIEVKDYRQHRRTKLSNLAEEVAIKARDTLAALVVAPMNGNDANERTFALAAVRCKRIGVVLQLAQPGKHSKLFPRAIDPADVQQRLKQLVKAIDPHPRVVEVGRTHSMPWEVSPVPSSGP